MSNVLDDTTQQQILALGRLGWSLRRIEQALAVRRETISGYLKAAGIAVHGRGRRSESKRKPAISEEVSTDLGPKPAIASPELSTDPMRPPPPGRAPSASACEPYREIISSSLRADFVLDALEQAIYARCDDTVGDLVHHSDRGSQYLSMRYTERLADAGIEPSVGRRGDSYDNALAESVIGLFKAEVIRRKGPWRTLETVEFATLTWVDWFNHRWLLEPIGYVPPAEYEARYYEQAAVA